MNVRDRKEKIKICMFQMHVGTVYFFLTRAVYGGDNKRYAAMIAV